MPMCEFSKDLGFVNFFMKLRCSELYGREKFIQDLMIERRD